MTVELEGAQHPVADAATGSAPAPRPVPTTAELRLLADNARYGEAVALLEGVDPARLDPEAQYLAGVCLGSEGQADLAIELLLRARAGGFGTFWCTYHLGIFERRRGRTANAAFYLTLALILEPEQIDPLRPLGAVAPGVDLAPLEAAQAGSRSRQAARDTFAVGCSALEDGNPGAAAFYFTIALVLDPDDGEARAWLLELAPDLSLDLLNVLGGGSAPAAGQPPSAALLQELANSGRHKEAAALLQGVDLEDDLGADFAYYAGVCLGAVNQPDQAITLLKRAAAAGFAAFWCAYHLGLFEKKRGNAAQAAHYFSTALMLDPERTDIYPLLEQVAPGIDTTPMGAAQVARKAQRNRQPPSARQLESLINGAKYTEAAALLEGVDLAADLPPDFLYMAAVCLGAGNAAASAIGLLKRAAEGGYPRFWCAYNLGLFEEKLGNPVDAACYYTAALLANPARTDIWERLVRMVPDAGAALLHKAQAVVPSSRSASEACRLAIAKLEAGSPAAAACCLTTALALDPRHEEARQRLLALAPDIALGLLVETDMDRLAEHLRKKLTTPASDEFDLERKIAWAEAAFQIYANTQHPSGRSLIPALEALFQRALASRQVGLDTLCRFHDKMYFLHWYWSSSWEAMRGVADRVMKPFAAAVRDGGIDELPPILPRPIGGKPLRLGYLAEFALLGNPIGRGVGDFLEVLSRYFPDSYELVLYAWSQYDDPFLTALTEHGITVRRFGPSSMSERIAAVADAVAADRIDILITDMNSALPAVLFERRAAPVQIFFQNGLPYWPLANIDGVFRIEFYDPRLDGFDPAICFDLSLGAWTQRSYDYDPPIEPSRIAAERARFPAAAKLIGIYGRLAKVTVEFLEMIEEVLRRHPQVVGLIGGTGYGDWIRDFIDERGLGGRLVLVDEYVDGHVWGHMIDVFVDTSWDVTVAGREIMVKGKPIVSLRTPTHERERVPMLIADDRATYIDLVSQLIDDPAFYDAACAATRDFVAAQPDEREYAGAVHEALSSVVRRVGASAEEAGLHHAGAAFVASDVQMLAANIAHDPALDRLVYGAVLDELRSSVPSRVTEVDFGRGGKPVEVVRACEVLYLPELHLQLWRDSVVPQEANFDPDAFDELRDNISSGAIRLPLPLDAADEVEDDVCILSNLYSNNFFHCFEELYKVAILERSGFQGRYILSPFGNRHFPGLPPFAAQFLELLGIRDDRITMCRAPTRFRSSWLTTRIPSDDTIAYSKVFLALREQLITAATTIAQGIGPRLYLERYPKRVVLNAEEVRECVSRYGFTTVDMAKLPVAQQIAAAHHAQVLLGTHGSGMLHCAFQERNSTVIECFSPNYMDFFILDFLHILEHRYFQIVAMDRRAPIPYPHGADVAIDCHHLELVLKQIPDR